MVLTWATQSSLIQIYDFFVLNEIRMPKMLLYFLKI